jgi:hypothetical protein
MKISYLLIILVLVTSCGKNDPYPYPSGWDDIKNKNDLSSNKVNKNKSTVATELKLPVIPKQSLFNTNKKKFYSTIKFNNNLNPFDEEVTLKFLRTGRLITKHLYKLESTYLGNKDNGTFFGLRQDDNLSWDTQWPIIFVNMNTFRVYAGDSVGKGAPIGYIEWNGRTAKLVFQTKYTINKSKMSISVVPPLNVPFVSMEDCPFIVKSINGCRIYVNTYNALYSIDFKAFGTVGPGIAKDILSVQTIMTLIKSFWSFDPDIEEIRKYYLVPILKTIKNIKRLPLLDKNSSGYLSKTQVIYTDLIVTSVDSLFKTQKMMPEAIENLGATGLGVLLAYIGAEDAGDGLISKNQPPWFKELVAPIIREFGIVAIDLIMNGTKTSLEKRLKRFTDLESDLTESIRRICINSADSQNECLNALN